MHHEVARSILGVERGWDGAPPYDDGRAFPGGVPLRFQLLVLLDVFLEDGLEEGVFGGERAWTGGSEPEEEAGGAAGWPHLDFLGLPLPLLFLPGGHDSLSL